MLAVALAVAMLPLLAAVMIPTTVSLPSATVSSVTATVMVLLISPAAKLSVWFTAV